MKKKTWTPNLEFMVNKELIDGNNSKSSSLLYQLTEALSNAFLNLISIVQYIPEF